MESPLATVPQSPTDPGLSWGNQSFNEFLAKASLVSIANKDLSGDDEDCPENLWNIDVSNPNGPGWPCVSVDWVDRKRNAVPHTRPLPFPYALSYSATYNHDGDGYNITLPGLAIPIFSGSMYIPLAHPGVTANWPGVAHWGVATFGFTLLTTYMVILDRLRRQETRLQQMEATTLNLFIIAGEYIRKGLVASWGGICATSAMLWQQVGGFCAESRKPGLQGTGLGPDPGPPQAGDPGQLEQVAVQNVCPPPETP
ncbi:MAG: hypothetical protein LQ339_006138 [Xanthoria mediterranea]|nr:MAG: hypothetical protein LQ339_006138 [Xanthoria mediterranea]